MTAHNITAADQLEADIHYHLNKYDWVHIDWAAECVPHKMQRETSFEEYHDRCCELVELKKYASTLAIKVIAAERLVDTAQKLAEALLSGHDTYGWTDAVCQSIAAYREAAQ